jgi:hypothetical protein
MKHCSVEPIPYVLTATLLADKLVEFQQGNITDVALAVWALDRFYASDQGRESFDPAHAAVIAEVIDDLMFADETAFQLDPEAIQGLVVRLRSL